VEVYDRVVIGFGPQGLGHLCAILKAWAAVGHGGSIAVVGDPDGSGIWNDCSMSNTQNTPPENEHRQRLIEDFIQKNEQVLRKYFRWVFVAQSAKMVVSREF
jgi:hypothetical protein